MTKTHLNSENEAGTEQQLVKGHPIAVVAERTGLSRDVLRVWERRYGAVSPNRSAGGQRLYTDRDVERFRLLAAATRNGRTISTVAGYSDEELQRMIADDLSSVAAQVAERPTPTASDRDSRHVAELAQVVAAALASTRRFDASALDRILRRAIAQYGLPTFLEDVVPHLMHRIGEAWIADDLTIAHEHLASAAVLSIIHESIRAVPERAGAPRMLVATPAGERHAVGAALVAAAAALDGWTIVYLGVDVPAAEIVSAADAVSAQAVGLSAIHASDPLQLTRELAEVREALPAHVPLFIGGSAARAVRESLAAPGVVVCASLAELRAALSEVHSINSPISTATETR